MNYIEQYNLWNSKKLEDEDLTEELKSISGSDKDIYERFYTNLKFGTAGLRGIIGAGSNRMNIYTLRRATKGLAEYLISNNKVNKIAIAFDSRNKSGLFAKTAASVLAANGIKVYLFEEIAPTPMLSWAVRYYGCTAGIVVTASHNPAEYNGYKVYGPDGCQISSAVADEVLSYIEKEDIFDIGFADYDAEVGKGNIEYVGNEAIDGYYNEVLKCRFNKPDMNRLTVAFTPLCGAGSIPVRKILQYIGINRLYVVEEQEKPDGSFKTCSYPNPEEPDAMKLGVELAERKLADILIGTDPDADRVGVAVRGKDGRYKLLTGNEVGVLLIDYIGKSLVENGSMPQNPLMVTSIVSTLLADAVAKSYGIETVRVLTGFKNIGEQILKLEEANQLERFVFGFEESCGYLAGTYVRDKDAVVASMLIAEMAAWYKEKGQTLIDVLDGIYDKFGYYSNKVINIAFEGAEGKEKMAGIMDFFYNTPPKQIDIYRGVEFVDYKKGIVVNKDGECSTNLPKADIFSITLENGSTVIVRPSGTEPKLKIYLMIRGNDQSDAETVSDKVALSLKNILKL